MEQNELQRRYERWLQEGERYKQIILFYHNHPERRTPKNEKYLGQIFRVANELSRKIIQFEKGAGFQKLSLK